MLTIARNAFLESIRQPVFSVLVLAGMLALVLNVSLAAFTLDDDNKILIDLGLSTLLLTGLLLAAFTATSVVSREIENRTVVTVLSKPVPRPAVVIGKYLGVAGALATAYWTVGVLFLLTVRHRVPGGGSLDSCFDGPVLVFGSLGWLAALILAGSANYLRRRPFSSIFVVALTVFSAAALLAAWSFDKRWRMQAPWVEWDSQLVFAVALVFEAVLVLAAVAVAASTRFGRGMTLLACGAVFLAGLVNEHLLGTLVADAGTAGWLRWLAWPAYTAIPNLQFFWPADALTQGHPLTTAHFTTVSGYAAAMIVAMISLAVVLFQGRDVG